MISLFKKFFLIIMPQLLISIPCFAESAHSKPKEKSSSFLEISTSWGPCPVVNGCHEVYKLSSDGEIYLNGKLTGKLSADKTKESLASATNIFKKNVCTASYQTDIFENYRLLINGKELKLGNNQGCDEMKPLVEMIKQKQP